MHEFMRTVIEASHPSLPVQLPERRCHARAVAVLVVDRCAQLLHV